jgi:hypothetical protein
MSRLFLSCPVPKLLLVAGMIKILFKKITSYRKCITSSSFTSKIIPVSQILGRLKMCTLSEYLLKVYMNIIFEVTYVVFL